MFNKILEGLVYQWQVRCIKPNTGSTCGLSSRSEVGDSCASSARSPRSKVSHGQSKYSDKHTFKQRALGVYRLTMAEQVPWELSIDQRKNTVTRVAANIASLSFSRGRQISDADAHRAAENAEGRAYTVAQVQAQTTTGYRPQSEAYEAYTRFT